MADSGIQQPKSRYEIKMERQIQEIHQLLKPKRLQPEKLLQKKKIRREIQVITQTININHDTLQPMAHLTGINQ
jgi:hypothetical protein